MSQHLHRHGKACSAQSCSSSAWRDPGRIVLNEHVEWRLLSPAQCPCSGISRGEPWATPQAAECLLGIRLALVGGCSLAHGAAICARVYFLTHQYYVYDFTYEFYVRANVSPGRRTSPGGRPEP